MMAQEMAFLKAYGVFQKMCALLQAAFREGQRLDQVERLLKTCLAEQGLGALEDYVEATGDGDMGPTVTCEGHVLERSEAPQARRYLSIFGELGIPRYTYSAGLKKAIEYAPLDARLGLPAGEISYVLEDFQQRLSVKDPFGRAAEDLKALLGTAVAVATAERANQHLAGFARTYAVSKLTQEQPPAAEKEGELLVVAGDGKGVKMRPPPEERPSERERLAPASEPAEAGEASSPGPSCPERNSPPPSSESATDASPDLASEPMTSGRVAGRQRQRRRKALARAQARRPGKSKTANSNSHHTKRGENKGRKRMAYVGAVYTIDRFPRTAEQVLDEIARREREKERPRPQHKHVWGEMTQLEEGERLDGRSLLFAELAINCHLRDPERQMTLICLMDGEEPLWAAQEQWLGRAIEILDFFHAMEHLWAVARVFHTGRAVDTFVEHHARMFLEGKVDYAARNFGRLMRKKKLRGKKATVVNRAIGYYRQNRQRMRYDEYLAQGYPIGSGMAEGTCRHLVKDRLELTGMQWEHPGAQAMIYLRALYLNDEWNQFIDYRVETEQKQLYGDATIYGKLTPYGQAA
jgi:hypothetical protein